MNDDNYKDLIYKDSRLYISPYTEDTDDICMPDICNKLNVYDWMKDLPKHINSTDIVEIRFKNTRKAYYKNVNQLRLVKGNIVAVEASPGHDIGVVSLTGELVLHQMKKNNIDLNTYEFKKIYRKAKAADISKWKEAIEREYETMLKARKIAEQLNLNMKIGDVEYQGDNSKAIFYYIADERVDFRELIKVLADQFHVRIEMRQIGSRQEAGRIGGIGPCGRELCCATWISNFSSVSTNAARIQDISLNPQKLAGQCSKLKCCLNFEVDCYIDALKNFPDKTIILETTEGKMYHQKTDVFKNIMWYSSNPNNTENLTAIPVERVKQIIELNKQGKIVDKLPEDKEPVIQNDFHNIVGQDSLTRFDKNFQKNKKNKPRSRNKNIPNQSSQPNNTQIPNN